VLLGPHRAGIARRKRRGERMFAQAFARSATSARACLFASARVRRSSRLRSKATTSNAGSNDVRRIGKSSRASSTSVACATRHGFRSSDPIIRVVRDLSATGLSTAAWRLPVRRCALPLSPAYGSAGQSQQIAGARRHRMLRAPVCNTPPPDPNMRALSPTAREARPWLLSPIMVQR
jgi:hypothetical protein